MRRAGLLILLLLGPACASMRVTNPTRCEGGSPEIAARLELALTTTGARALLARPDLDEDAKAGLTALADDHPMDALPRLLVALDRAGDMKGEKYQLIEWRFAQALLRAGLHFAAAERMIAMIERGSSHVAYSEAALGLLVIEARLADRPTARYFDQHYTADFARLRVAVFDRLNLVVGLELLRQGNFGEATPYLQAVNKKGPNGPLAEQAVAGLRQLLGQMAEQKKKKEDLTSERLELERSLGLKDADLVAKIHSCEIDREKEVASKYLESGELQARVLTSIEKRRAE